MQSLKTKLDAILNSGGIAKNDKTSCIMISLNTSEIDYLKKCLERSQGHVEAIMDLIDLVTSDLWMPIETAPKDGTEIIVCGKNACDGEYITTAEYTEKYNMFMRKGTTTVGHAYLTHWMPLPKLPNTIEMVECDISDLKQRVDEFTHDDDATYWKMRHKLLQHKASSAIRDLYEAMEAAVDCGMVPISSAKEGGAARHARHTVVADMIRDALTKHKPFIEEIKRNG